MARPWEWPPNEYDVYKKNDIYEMIFLTYTVWQKNSPDLCKANLS